MLCNDPQRNKTQETLLVIKTETKEFAFARSPGQTRLSGQSLPPKPLKRHRQCAQQSLAGRGTAPSGRRGTDCPADSLSILGKAWFQFPDWLVAELRSRGSLPGDTFVQPSSTSLPIPRSPSQRLSGERLKTPRAKAPSIHCKGQGDRAEMDPAPDLYRTPGDSLEHFVQHSLQPQRDWKEEGKDAWGRVERFLRGQCFRDELLLDQEVKVLKVVKGGSSGKGTTLNHRSDQDMALFLSCFSSFRHQATHREFIINFIEKKLLHYRKSLAYNITVVHHRAGNRTPRSLTLEIQLRKSDDIIWMDVLPAYDALGSFSRDSKPDPKIYEDLIMTEGNPGEFSPSFTELQRHFVKSRPVKLKDLLRLVKFWYKQCLRSKHRRAALPPKYSLELLTIYAWEMGTESSESFKLDEGFVAVMELLRDYRNICVYWTRYYNFQNEVVRNYLKQQLKGDRPIILDPADPTNNLGSRDGWDLVASEASYCLQQPCCWTANPSGGWNVPPAREVQVTVKQTGKETWSLWVDPYNPIREMKAQIKRINGTLGELRISFQDPQGDRQLLSSQKTLSDYGIFSKVTIRVLETFYPEIQVFVKNSSGQSKPYAISPNATINDLKEKIEDGGGPYRDNQVLMWGNKKLKNGCSLAKLQIKDCDTIQVIRVI